MCVKLKEKKQTTQTQQNKWMLSPYNEHLIPSFLIMFFGMIIQNNVLVEGWMFAGYFRQDRV